MKTPGISKEETGADGIRVLFDAEEVEGRVGELARRISRDFVAGRPVLVGILTGAVPFAIDLLRAMPLEFAKDLEYDFVKISSYRGRESTGRPQVAGETAVELAGRQVLLIDGIVDTGGTMQAAIAAVKAHAPESIHTCTLIDKPGRRQVPVRLDYVGYTIGDLFVVGYGMDYCQRYRALPWVGVLDA